MLSLLQKWISNVTPPKVFGDVTLVSSKLQLSFMSKIQPQFALFAVPRLQSSDAPKCVQGCELEKSLHNMLTNEQLFAKIFSQLNEPRNLRMKDFVVTEQRGTLLPSDVM